MKKFKKWQVVLLIIMGIGGFWLSQNMWIVQKKIKLNDYEQSLIDSKWRTESGAIWSFDEEININYRDDSKSKSWEINEDLLITKGNDERFTSTWKIKVFRENFINILLLSPAINGIQPQKKLKRIE